MAEVPKLNLTSRKLAFLVTTKQHISINLVDIISNTFLFGDVLLQLFATQNRWRFLTRWYNIIDFATIIFVYIFNITHMAEMAIPGAHLLMFTLTLAAIFFSLRIMRIFRLFRHSGSSIALYLTFTSNFPNIFLFISGVMAASTIAATLVFHAELWSDSPFNDIFNSLWWAVVTMTTVGYGDIVPDTVAGKVIAGTIIMMGLLVIAVPIVLITSSYGDYYTCYHNFLLHTRRDEYKTTTNKNNGENTRQ